MEKHGFTLEQHRNAAVAITRIMADMNELLDSISDHYPARDWQTRNASRNLQRAHANLELARCALEHLLSEEQPAFANSKVYRGG